jgi:photosystem II stability/assembly factor-like uncharacterized protein
MSAPAAPALPSPYRGLRWRLVGPFRGGRSVAVAGDPLRPHVFYFGACAGGVWKTVNAGATWENVSDGQIGSAAIGAVAVADSDPDVVYVGTGEADIRGNVVAGDGVYRSTDGGRTWRHLGLADTRHIDAIRIHPQNPDVAYVAALGHCFGPNAERGVYRTTDGGRTWARVLYRDARTGCADLTLDPTNPRVLYAALWEFQRYPHKLESGGPGSGLFKSTDGGDTWAEITRNPGLPRGVIGRVGVAVSPADGNRVWALVEAEDGALFRSDDGGDTWRRLNEDPQLRARPFYYMHVFADPCDRDRLYILNYAMWRSRDGGRSFEAVPTPHADNHDLWIDPRNPERMIEGNDGGATVTFDGGRSWSTIYNQPTAQFYHVTTDHAFPYRLYGAQQDNTTLSVPSRSDEPGITLRECYDVGGAESGYIAVDPEDPNVVYAGSSGGGEGGRLTRYDHRRRERRDISPWPQRTAGLAACDYRYRFQWTSPIHLSPHDRRTLYMCANRVFRTTDEGHSWEIVSPDLTRNDPDKLGPSGGPITPDHTGVEVYCTIFAFAESPLQRGLLWAGSDDGLIHVSRDGGATWENVTPSPTLLPEWALISQIAPSPHDPGTAYVAATRYKLDDLRPYLLKTNDCGRSWAAIAGGIPPDDFTRAICPDPVRKGLLFCGTESGVYVSRDDGVSWASLRGNLPIVPIHDLTVKDDDLVVATHGRSFWILDDITPLREDVDAAAPHLFTPRRTVRHVPDGARSGRGGPEAALPHPTVARVFPGGGMNYMTRPAEGGYPPEYADAGQNPPLGVIIRFHLPAAGPATLTVRDARGQVATQVTLQAQAGAGSVVWDMRYPAAVLAQGDESLSKSRLTAEGPLAPPGTYTVELAAAGRTLTRTFELVKDPRVEAGQADLQAQFELLVQVRDKVTALHRGLSRIRSVREQLDEWCRRAEGHRAAAGVAERAEAVKARLADIEAALVPVRRGAHPTASRLPPRLNDELLHLAAVIASAACAPNEQSRALFAETAAAVDRQLERLQAVMDTDVRAFSEYVQEFGIPAIRT